MIFAPLRGLRRNIAITFGTNKLEWRVYQTEFENNMLTRFDTTHERDGQTDGRTPHEGRTCSLAMAAVARQKF